MRKKLLLLTTLLAITLGLRAENADGILSVNVMNAIEGYSGGRMDIVLNNTNTQEWASLQFDIKAPAGVTITGGEEGELFNGHTLNGEEVDATNHIWRFSAARTSGGSANFKSTNGTLMTVKFTVANPYTTENGQIELSTISVGTINAVNYDVANFNAPFAIDNTSFTIDENARSLFAVPPTGTYDVTVKRKLKANVWNTIVLPFDISQANIETIFGANTEVAEFTGATPAMSGSGPQAKCTGIAVNFTKTLSDNMMYATAPYLIKVKEDKNQLLFISSTFDNDLYDWNYSGEAMKGSYIYRNVPEGSLYISDNHFKYSGGNATIKGMRAYFTFTKTLDGYTSDVSASRSIIFNIDGESTTGLFNVEEGTIEKDNKYYNLKGQRVASPTKGVYVVEGKKVMIK